MIIKDLLKEDLFISKHFESKKEIIKYFGSRLETKGYVENGKKVYKKALALEKKFIVFAQNQSGILPVLCKGVKEPSIIFSVNTNMIWKSSSSGNKGELKSIFFVTFGEDQEVTCDQVVDELTALLHTETFNEKVGEIESFNDLIESINEKEIIKAYQLVQAEKLLLEQQKQEQETKKENKEESKQETKKADLVPAIPTKNERTQKVVNKSPKKWISYVQNTGVFNDIDEVTTTSIMVSKPVIPGTNNQSSTTYDVLAFNIKSALESNEILSRELLERKARDLNLTIKSSCTENNKYTIITEKEIDNAKEVILKLDNKMLCDNYTKKMLIKLLKSVDLDIK